MPLTGVSGIEAAQKTARFSCVSADRFLAETLRVSVHRAWKDAASGQFTALYQLRCVLQQERERTGRINNDGDGL